MTFKGPYQHKPDYSSMILATTHWNLSLKSSTESQSFSKSNQYFHWMLDSCILPWFSLAFLFYQQTMLPDVPEVSELPAQKLLQH